MLYTPPPTDIDNTLTMTQKTELACEFIIPSVLFFKDSDYFIADDTVFDWNLYKSSSMNLHAENIDVDIDVASTWEELDINSYDIPANLIVKKTFKVKCKIKKVTKYNPTIVVD